MKFGRGQAERMVTVVAALRARCRQKTRGRFAAQRVPIFVLLSMFLGLSAISQTSHATVMQALTLRDLVRDANVIAVVEVDAQRALRDEEGRIYTITEARVVTSLLGAGTGQTLRMRTWGGIVGRLAMRVEGEATFALHHRALVFLEPTASGELHPIGMSQGVFHATDQGTFLQSHGAALLDARGHEVQGALPAAVPQASILAQVAALIGELHGRP